MTTHKHADMIKAKADNMDLVVFFKADALEWRKADSQNVFPTSDSPFVEYFLCHPKHADVCLHWLNGGDVQGVNDGDWVSFALPEPVRWNPCTAFMDDEWDIRIKPRKEKRWIVVKGGTLIINHLFESQGEAEVVCGRCGHDVQFIEIKVEV